MKTIRHSLRWLLLSAPLLFATVLMADETEIYFSDKSGEVAPNVLFLIDASGSMNQPIIGDALGRTRLGVLKDSFTAVMNAAPANLNVGLMHYANNGLGEDYWWSSIKGVNFPATPMEDKVLPLIASHKNSDNLPNPHDATVTVREFLSDVVGSWNADGYTPIVDSLYEASRYFRGDAVGWGMDVPALGWSAHPLTYDAEPVCTASHTAECVNSWGQCNANIVPGSCDTVYYNLCCNWVETGSDGSGYCEDNNYSCTDDITTCEHTICDTLTGAPAYQSPIEYSCQANYLVLMSDGKPEYPYYPGAGEPDGTLYYPPSSERYPGGTGFAADMTAQLKPAISTTRVEDYIGVADCTDSPNGYNSGTCGSELTHWMASADQNPTLDGTQVVNTYAVAFAMNDQPTAARDYLESLVTAEDGYFEADDADALAGAFNAILNSINKNGRSFSAPAYTVDQSTLLSHSDEVYIPLFDQSPNVTWPGNLKKFKLDLDGSVTGKKGQIYGKNNQPALNEKGEFLNDAHDFWGDAVSGGSVAAGGAASQLPSPDSRYLYTDASGVDLTSTGNKLDASNTNITSTMLGGAGTYTTDNTLQDWWAGVADGISCFGTYTDCDGVEHEVAGNPFNNNGCVNIQEVTTCPLPGSDISADDRTALLNYARGENPDGTFRKHMGDMLNTKPVVVTYKSDSGTDSVSMKSYVFAATNEGYLHAIDTDTGVEKWAFMPKSLLKNINLFYQNEASANHVYGIDGDITVWEYDGNHDGKIRPGDTASGDKIYLYFGMRRGGQEYYALDISNISSPSIAWHISNTDTDFTEMAQTWSKPTLAKMRIAENSSTPKVGSLVDVLIFGGGFDGCQDGCQGENPVQRLDSPDAAERAALTDIKGADVFIVNAKTGARIWSLRANVSGAAAQLLQSVPADIRIMDMDRNGALDRLYFADTGGTVWRVDMDVDLFDTDNTTWYNYSKARLSKFAVLGGTGTAKRMFFHEPDVALMKDKGKTIMTLAIGSGYQSHPLDPEVQDRFYVLIDRDPYARAPDTSKFPIQENSSLASITLPDGSDNTAVIGGNKTLLSETGLTGWYYDLPNDGEKVLAPAVTFLNKIIFSTFAPVDEDGNGKEDPDDPCEVPPNSARAYVMNLLNGGAVADLNRDGNPERSVVSGVNEILGDAQIVFRVPSASDGGACTENDCQQTVEIRIGKMSIPLMDEGNSTSSGAGGGVNAVAGSVDLTSILPRVFWVDHDVSE